jgi:hypothetical protein
MSEGESSCFYHEHKRAETVCDHCGRFLCKLCEVDWHSKTLCPDCITLGRRKRKSNHDLSTMRTRYDSQALVLGILPIVLPILWWVMWIFAPIAIIMTIRHRNAPCSFLPGRRRRVRFTFAILFAIIQIALTGCFIILFYS